LYFYFYFVSDQVSLDNRVAFDNNQSIQSEEDGKNAVNYVTSQPLESQIASSSRAVGENIDAGRRRDKAHVAAEEFPLPPASNPLIQRQALAAQEAQLHVQGPQHQTPLPEQKGSIQSPSPTKHVVMAGQPGGYTHLAHPRSEENISLPQQKVPHRQDSRLQQSQDQQQSEAVAFRALPLLSSDLPYTNITVSHSFVRPNDRGKEVLSFIVFVDPGNGRDGWKVEKMYSDVLGLDQRVRSSVGKGVGKRIANLPEGKLWKDHAPAKVDQRKVRMPASYPRDVIAKKFAFLIHLGGARKLPSDFDPPACEEQR
jgi:RalA-binding protein 1